MKIDGVYLKRNSLGGTPRESSPSIIGTGESSGDELGGGVMAVDEEGAAEAEVFVALRLDEVDPRGTGDDGAEKVAGLDREADFFEAMAVDLRGIDASQADRDMFP